MIFMFDLFWIDREHKFSAEKQRHHPRSQRLQFKQINVRVLTSSDILMPGEQVLAEFYKTDLEASLLTKINYS
jgi:hypothetical protein